MRYRLIANVDTQSILRDYFGLTMALGSAVEFDELALDAARNNTRSGRYATLADIIAYLTPRGGCVQLSRKPGDPPQRYGPYKPIAKALP